LPTPSVDIPPDYSFQPQPGDLNEPIYSGSCYEILSCDNCIDDPKCVWSECPLKDNSEKSYLLCLPAEIAANEEQLSYGCRARNNCTAASETEDKLDKGVIIAGSFAGVGAAGGGFILLALGVLAVKRFKTSQSVTSNARGDFANEATIVSGAYTADPNTATVQNLAYDNAA